MFLEGRAYRRVGGIVGRNVGERHAAQFGAKTGTQGDNVHRRASLARGVLRQVSSKSARPTRRRANPALVLFALAPVPSHRTDFLRRAKWRWAPSFADLRSRGSKSRSDNAIVGRLAQSDLPHFIIVRECNHGTKLF